MDRQEILDDLISDRLTQQADDRRFIYRDVEELILVGHLTHTLEIESVAVTFKSLTPYEARMFGGGLTGHRNLGWLVAASVMAIEGHRMSYDDIPHVYKTWVEPLPLPTIDELYKTVVTPFLNRIHRARRVVEAFCYEGYSRDLWLSLGRPYNYEINSKANTIFQWWCTYNHISDERVGNEREWAHTRMIVASMSSEGAKKLFEHAERATEKREEGEKLQIEKTVNWVIKGDLPPEKVFIEFQGKKVEVQKMRFAATFDDLREEMRRVFDGDKDYHDSIVDDYYAKIREGVDNKRKAARKKAQKERESLPQSTKNLVGYTQNQLKELRPDLSTKKTTASEGAVNSEFEHVYSRYIKNEIKPGVLGPDMRVTDNDRSTDTPKDETNDLMDKLKARRPDPLKMK